jgi:hypothetical protein
VDTLIGIAIVAAVFLILGLVALIRCDKAAIPQIVRYLSPFNHPDLQVPTPPVRSLNGRSAARSQRRRRVKR